MCFRVQEGYRNVIIINFVESRKQNFVSLVYKLKGLLLYIPYKTKLSENYLPKFIFMS